MSNSTKGLAVEGIAIVGMTGRFPGARSVDELWRNLRDGVESIRTFSDEELIEAGVEPHVLADVHYVKAGTVLDGAKLFDAEFFGFNPLEAEITDPQHRLFLECAHEALERAGYDPQQYPGLIGVFAGTTASSYQTHLLQRNLELIRRVPPLQIVIGNDKDFIPTRVSYKLNLKGPSINVQSACSTSLVAVHMACQSLLEGACDIALAGGVSIRFPQPAGYFHQEEGIMSPDGHCRAFDAKAQGCVGGNGVAIVVLKRLSEAMKDGDIIHAVIRGTACNNDGSSKVGYTAPSVEGQAEVIATALAMADVEPESVTYVETHGTGTLLGDPIEVAALTRAFRSGTNGKGFCALGSVKTNLGHLDAAAGATGLIKTVLQLQHKQICPSLHFEKPNPRIDFENGPFFVNSQLRKWESDSPRVAGVSSFGIGGTNAHVVVQEAPQVTSGSTSRKWQLLTLSAKSQTALDQMTAELADHVEGGPEQDLADVAYTLHVGRTPHSYRRVVLASDPLQAAQALRSSDPTSVATFYTDTNERPVVFMFPGGGAQYVNMGRQLYEQEALYRKRVDECAELLRAHIGCDIREWMFPSAEREEDARAELRRTRLGLPALFVTEYALAQLWISWGISPEAMIGHSLGEYAAACIAGVFTLEDALALVATRSRLMGTLASGAMLVVPLSEDEVLPFLNEALTVAVINGPSQCVVSGESAEIDRIEALLHGRGCDCRRLHIEVASHSHVVEPILKEFTRVVAGFELRPPRIPYISNLSGTWITAEEATDPNYWARHLRHTVRFGDGLAELTKDPSRVMLEVGPGQTLATIANQHPARSSAQVVVTSLRHPHDPQHDVAYLLKSLSQLWLGGVSLSWKKFHEGERRNRVLLPTYPFERQEYWAAAGQLSQPSMSSDPLARKEDISEWFYTPVWEQTISMRHVRKKQIFPQQSRILVFLDSYGVASDLCCKLEEEGHDVVRVLIAKQLKRCGENAYSVRPASCEDYDGLIRELRGLGKLPNVILHAWSVTAVDGRKRTIDRSSYVQQVGFYSLLQFAQALGNQNVNHPIRLFVFSNNVYRVAGERVACPEKATLFGPIRVLPQEYPNLQCRHIDVLVPAHGGWERAELIGTILNELSSESRDESVALRGPDRWIQKLEPVRVGPEQAPRLRERGVYLITGGLGGIALQLAEFLARECKARLALVSRSTFPEKVYWGQWLKSHDDADPTSTRIRQLMRMEKAGAELMVVSADVSNLAHMRDGIHRIERRFGRLHGVIHTAGVAGGGLTQLKSSEMAASVLSPKVDGVLVLESLLQDVELDFFVLCSSLASIVGGVGHIDYAAANAFLDAFAQSRRGNKGWHTVSINWNAWKRVGMAAALSLPGELRRLQDEVHQFGLSAEEGVEAFKRAVGCGLPQVAVSTQDLKWLVEQHYSLIPGTAAKKEQPARAKHMRPRMGVAYVAPRNETEHKLAEIWQSLLGIEQVGVHDNFFNLGGHSLLGTQLISRVHDTFNVDIPLRRLFEAPSVAALAEIISGLVTDIQQQNELEVLSMVQALSESEIEAEFERRSQAISGSSGNGETPLRPEQPRAATTTTA